jgi:peptide/nickel transport system ATP-binding protein
MSENILELKDLCVTYTTDNVMSHAVNNVTLSIKKGEILGLVGETGAGKTTTALSLLRLLPRYTSEVSGKVIFDGRDINELKENEMRQLRGKHISMIFQDPMTSLNPVFPVGNQIGDVIRVHDKELSNAEIEEKVDDILKLVGITPQRKRDYPHQFSGGMKQRVMIAIAIACRPELLIADEPTTALDVTIQAQVIQMMRELQRELNSAVLIITHDLGIVANFCDNVAIMYSGEIIEYGTLEDIFDKGKPHHPYTIGLFGSIPNIDSISPRLDSIRGLMPHPAELPIGCKFGTRCDKFTEECGHGDIPMFEDNGHLVKCLLYKKGGQ